MEQILKRSPYIGRQILQHLDDKSLATSKMIGKDWNIFILNEKNFWGRMILNQIGNNSKFLESWKNIVVKTPTKLVKKMAIAVDQLMKMSGTHKRYLYFPRGYDFLEVCKWSPLHIFAGSNNLELYQYAMEKGIEKNPTADDGLTPYFLAAVEGHFEICKFIIECEDDKNPMRNNGAKVGEPTLDGATPFHMAALLGNFEICELIIQNVEDKNPATNHIFGSTPLDAAASEGHFEICKLIIENVRDKNPADSLGRTPLQWAASKGSFEICKLIIGIVENKNPSDINGFTPLHIAAYMGYFKICKLIIENVENKNPANNDGSTPLYMAAWMGNFEICKLIIENVEDKNPAKNDGRTPLSIAASNGYLKIYKLILSNLELGNPSTPFMYALRNGHLKICYQIVKKSVTRL